MPAHGGAILVVDDDPMVRRLVARLLADEGFRVELAADGIEAVERGRELGAALSMILLDLEMPRMSGAEAWAKLRELVPSVPVVVMTGRHPEDARECFGDERPPIFLPKPFLNEDLLDAVKRAVR